MSVLRRPDVPHSGLLVIVGLIALAGLGVAAHGAVAGDAVAVIDPASDEIEASAGETVEIDVLLQSDGSYTGEGLASYSFVVAIHPDLATIESVEAGPYLAGDDGEVEADVTHLEDGAARIEAERVGVGDDDDGVTGTDVAATVRLRIADDSPSATATFAVTETRTAVADSDYPIRSFGREAIVSIDGGGEDYEPRYGTDDEESADDGEETDAEASDGVSGVTTADEVDRDVAVGSDDTDATAGSDADDAAGDGDPVPGFGPIVALAALLAAAGRLWYPDGRR